MMSGLSSSDMNHAHKQSKSSCQSKSPQSEPGLHSSIGQAPTPPPVVLHLYNVTLPPLPYPHRLLRLMQLPDLPVLQGQPTGCLCPGEHLACMLCFAAMGANAL